MSLAWSAAFLAGRLHEAGFAFRDLKPPNLIVVGRVGLIPVDLDDVSRPRRVPRRIAWRNLAALDAYAQRAPQPLGVRARWGALAKYSSVRGLGGPRELLAPILTLSRQKRRRWRDVHGS